MPLECSTSAAERQELPVNDLNKPKHKASYVRYALMETTIETDCGKRCS